MREVFASAGETPVTVCIDFRHPQAYLALDSTLALEEALGVAFDWLPLILPPLSAPGDARAEEDRGTRHRRLRAAYTAAEIHRYARLRGLQLADIYRAPDPTLACLGLLWARHASPAVLRAYVTAVFERYWRAALQLGDPVGLRAVLEAVGADVPGFERFVAGAGPSALEAIQAHLRGTGLFSVPAYLVGNDVFYGRAHLPLIRWLLTCRRGQPPI